MFLFPHSVLLLEPISASNVSSKFRHLHGGGAVLSHAHCCYDSPSHSSSVSCLFKCGLRWSFMNETMWSKHHLTSGASDQRLKQARKEWIYLESREKAWEEKKNISPTVSLHTGPTDHRRTPTLEGAVGERRRFDFWWVRFIEINPEIPQKVLNVEVLFCWVCTVTAAAMPLQCGRAYVDACPGERCRRAVLFRRTHGNAAAV